MAHQRTGGSSCLNCRARKMRCDRVLPQCSRCKQRALECLVPEAPPRLLWLPTKTLADSIAEQEDLEVDMHVKRQHLFTGRQQAQNADDLLALTTNISLGSLLEKLDQQADRMQNGITVSNGPFRVFRSVDITAPSPISPIPSTDIANDELLRLFSGSLDDVLTEEDIALMHLSPNLCIPDELIVASEEQNEVNPPASKDQKSLIQSPVSGGLLTLKPSIRSPSDLEDFTMPTARLLLDHYQAITVTFYIPAPAESKTPWEILYVPNVLSTLGEIALTGNSSDAKVALLFAVLAISAFRLNVFQPPRYGSTSQDWRTLGNIYREKATRRLQMTLRNLSAGPPKKEKYKNILMPLLSMVTICVVSGEMRNAAHYLSDIEQIITLYGVPKVQKSRKVKMLHSIYLYLRVLTEGIHIYDRSRGTGSIENVRTDSAISTDQQATTWDTLLCESSSPYDTLNLDFTQNVAPFKSMFEQIYSLPESLFKLIFKTTQLASEIERLRRRRRTDHDAFAEKVKKLENDICEWEYYYRESGHFADATGTSSPQQERFPYHLTKAIHAALMIYFYRAIIDVNAIALQPYVQQTIYHLVEFDKYKEKRKNQYSAVCWPGFIAGCEATTPQSRQQISEWLQQTAQSNGILMFKVALQAVQKVWAARRLPGQQNVSWSSVLGDSTDLRVLVLT